MPTDYFKTKKNRCEENKGYFVDSHIERIAGNTNQFVLIYI